MSKDKKKLLPDSEGMLLHLNKDKLLEIKQNATDLTSCTIMHVRIERKKIFKGGAITRIDYYILQKSVFDGKTIINDEEHKEHKINLRDWKFLPNYNFKNISSIITSEENGIKIIYSASQYDKRKPYMSEKKIGKYIFPVRHSHTINDGDIDYWSSTKDSIGKSYVEMFGIPKVILIKGLYTYPYNDYDGTYGMSNYSFGIPITSKKQGDDIVKAINTDAFGEILKATKWSSGFTDHNMFKYFKPDFYKYFLDGRVSVGGTITAKHAYAVKPKKSTSKKTNKQHSVCGRKTKKQKFGFLKFFKRYTRKTQ